MQDAKCVQSELTSLTWVFSEKDRQTDRQKVEGRGLMGQVSGSESLRSTQKNIVQQHQAEEL